MKTVLFTGWDAPYKALADITVKRMRAYAVNHGIELQPFSLAPPGLNIYWTGVARGLELLRGGYDRVMYLDVDQLITNMDRPPTCSSEYGFWCSKDWGEDATEPWHFSACGWIAHGDCIPMFEDVLAMEPEWRDKPFQEQGPWQEWMRKKLQYIVHQLKESKPTDPPGFINVNHRRLFNAVPDDVCPGKVPEPWQPGDFAAHLTMLPIDERVKLAQKFLK